MNKLITGVAALTVLFAAPALAADIPLKAPPRPAVFSWTGCYLGVNAGWIGSAGDQDIDTRLSGVFLNQGNTFAIPPAKGLLDRHFSHDMSSGTAGITTGCNIQYGSWVWGFESDSNWSGIDDTVSARFPSIEFLPGAPLNGVPSSVQTITRKLDYFSTYRGRLGFAVDRWMLFATGGAVVAHIKGETDILYGNDGGIIPVLANFHFFGDRKVWRMGWTAGGGLEYAFTDNWSLKAEYLFLDLRDLNYEAFCFTCNPNVGQSTNTRIEFREHVARVGLNYRFLWGELPVVARY